MGSVCRLISCLLTIALLAGQVSGTLFCRECQKTHELQYANNYGNSKIRKEKFEPEETQSTVNHSASKVHETPVREYLKDNNNLSHYSNGSTDDMEKPLEYKLWRGKWLSTKNLTYSFFNFSESSILSIDDIRFAVASAFSKWAAVVELDFTESHDYNKEANIKIMFTGRDHTNPWSFDGPGGRLASSFPPEDGRFYLDSEELWAVNMEVIDDDLAMDLESIALHEIGHLIGLGHSKLSCSIMFGFISLRQIKHHLTCDDIQGAMVLYGPRIASSDNPYVGPDGKFQEYGCLKLCHRNDPHYDPAAESDFMPYFTLGISFIILIIWLMKCSRVRTCFDLLFSLLFE